MQYFIGISNELSTRTEITAEEFYILKKSRTILINALDIEEKYDILISNYLTFEKEILNISCEMMVRNDFDHINIFYTRHKFNICLVNLLTSARLYLDQLIPNVESCIPDSQKEIKSIICKEYDGNLEYRYMEALRNYVQHCGIPVHMSHYSLSQEAYEGNDFFEYSLNISSSSNRLKEDNKFKKSVLDELGEEVDLNLAVRGYVESISKIHEATRELISGLATDARKTIEGKRDYYKSFYNNPDNLSAFEYDGDGTLIAVPLIINWDDARIDLQKRNRVLVNLRRRYVTNRVFKLNLS